MICLTTASYSCFTLVPKSVYVCFKLVFGVVYFNHTDLFDMNMKEFKELSEVCRKDLIKLSSLENVTKLVLSRTTVNVTKIHI